MEPTISVARLIECLCRLEPTAQVYITTDMNTDPGIPICDLSLVDEDLPVCLMVTP